jgi:phosphoribosylaminoimidazole-succinocarboxamide synthase
MATKRTRKQLYEGKAKILFEGPEAGTLIQYFKDDATAFNNKKKAVISGKGVLNNRISEFIMLRLGEIGIPTHFIKRINMREQLIKQVEIIPLEVIVRNIAAGSLTKRLGIPEGTKLSKTLVEFSYKNDELEDPLVGEDHIMTLGWADPLELEEILTLTLRINDFLYGMFAGVGITLVDFKIEYGRLRDEEGEYIALVLADEISPDSCRLWDAKTNEKLDKDRFRRDMGGVAEAYQEVAKRLGIFIPDGQEEE